MDTARKDDGDRDQVEDGQRDLSDTPEVGLIADEDLPQDLQPGDDERDGDEGTDGSEADDEADDPGRPGGTTG